jgi:LAO/AO transport system kinase
VRYIFYLQKKKTGKCPFFSVQLFTIKVLNDVQEKIDEFIQMKIKSGSFNKTRQLQAEKRFDYWVQEFILQKAKEEQSVGNSYDLHKKNASALLANPSTEAKIFVEELLKK